MYFSNRSAAYLKIGDAKSKALKDAERCMELAPQWPKSYSRLGAAQYALRRFDAAVETFKVKHMNSFFEIISFALTVVIRSRTT